MSRYVVIGAGAVGGALAATLHEAGVDCVLVARGAALDAIGAHGLTFARSSGTRRLALPVAGGPDGVALRDGDVIVLATKAQDSEATLAAWAWQPVRFADRDGTASELPLLVLQNGLDGERAALRRFDTVLGAAVLIAASHTEPGVVAVRGAGEWVGELHLGACAGPDGGDTGAVAADLAAAGWLVHEVADVARWKAWKLLHNVTNAIEVLGGARERRDELAALVVGEAEAVLAADGVTPADPAREHTGASLDFDDLGDGSARQSTWQSVARGVPHEVDFLNGEIALRGRLHGIATPYARALQQVLGVSGRLGEAPETRDVEEVFRAVRSSAWREEWARWQRSRALAVGAPHGLAALTGTHWLAGEPEAVDGVPGRWADRAGRVVGVGLKEPVSLAPGEEAPLGGLLLRATARNGSVGLRVLDPEAPARTSLAGIDAFPPRERWLLDGRFAPAPPDASIAVERADGSVGAERLAGTVRFDVDGQEAAISVFLAEGGRLWATFADATNGDATKQFRFLDLPAPAPDGTVVVDLNRAYLPPCAFGDGYGCPLPPAENRLPFALAAGERFPRRREAPRRRDAAVGDGGR